MRCGIFPTTIIRTAEHLKEADVIFSDNFFDLMPGETRTVRVASELNAKQLARLAENLDCFTFIIGASNYEEVGIYVTENNADFSVNPSVEKFFDYKAFGKYIGDAYYGEFVDGGFIYNDTDTSLLDILYQDEPMTMGGM